jgi:hypothetical protein
MKIGIWQVATAQLTTMLRNAGSVCETLLEYCKASFPEAMMRIPSFCALADAAVPHSTVAHFSQDCDSATRSYPRRVRTSEKMECSKPSFDIDLHRSPGNLRGTKWVIWTAPEPFPPPLHCCSLTRCNWATRWIGFLSWRLAQAPGSRRNPPARSAEQTVAQVSTTASCVCRSGRSRNADRRLRL